MSTTLARTQLRHAELLAVVNGERGRVFFTKGPWLDRKTGAKITREQSRALGELMKAGLIITQRSRVSGPILAVRTMDGFNVLGDWTQPSANRNRA